MYNKNLIALYGASGAGKDTVARIIQNFTSENPRYMPLSISDIIYNKKEWGWLYHSKYHVKKFATEPKRIVAGILGVDESEMENREFKHTYHDKYGKTTVQLLIDVAQGMKQIVSEDVWVDVLFKGYDEWQRYANVFYIISDMRFPYEYDAIKSRNGICVKIVNDQVISDLPIDNLLEDKEFDYTIYNDMNNPCITEHNILTFLRKFDISTGVDTEHIITPGYIKGGREVDI